jgi:hypothetical protein
VSDTHVPRTHRRRGGDQTTLAAAASYLGTSVPALRGELHGGKSLAQVAKETGGKSEAGLIAAVTQAQQHRITKATQHLDQRIKTQVQTPGGPRHNRVIASLRKDAQAYLGLSSAQLRAEERGGKTLAQIAQNTPGKSEAGLISAMVSSRTAQMESAVKAGRIDASTAHSSLARLRQRVSAYVHHALRIRVLRSAS